jgi:hypothetical protein
MTVKIKGSGAFASHRRMVLSVALIAGCSSDSNEKSADAPATGAGSTTVSSAAGPGSATKDQAASLETGALSATVDTAHTHSRASRARFANAVALREK